MSVSVYAVIPIHVCADVQRCRCEGRWDRYGGTDDRPSYGYLGPVYCTVGRMGRCTVRADIYAWIPSPIFSFEKALRGEGGSWLLGRNRKFVALRIERIV